MPNLDDVGETDKEVEKLIARIEACQGDSDLNDWEEEFLDDVRDALKSGARTELTYAQMATLERIETICAEGRDVEGLW